MDFLQPATLKEALEMKAAHPEALPIQGGTDVMVEINLDHHRPKALLDLNRLRELGDWASEDGLVRVGAGVTYARILRELPMLPGLAMASRTVGSPQIRNRGTVGGNLGTASPAGDAHPPLLASDALVELASASGTRRVPARDFFVGPKKSAMRPEELVTAFLMRPARGGQQFSKVGTRNAMVIAVCSFAIDVDHETRKVGTGIGSAGPTPLRATEAEAFAEGELDWENRKAPTLAVLERFGALVAAAAKPIDDIRGLADYRRRALAVMGRRCLAWAWAA